MTDFGHDGGVTSARLIGAVAGSAISLVYLLPKHRREAAVRFLTGLACGLIFGGPTGVWGAGQLGLEGRLSPAEIMLAGATLASFTAWWGLGVLVRLTGRGTRWVDEYTLILRCARASRGLEGSRGGLDPSRPSHGEGTSG